MAISSFLVLLGGSLGAVCRCAVSIQMKRIFSTRFPLATFVINLSGSFLLGLLLASGAGSMMRLFLGTGFLGGFTTFSTFQVENVTLCREGKYGMLLGYAVLSAGLCIAFAALGFRLGS